MEGTALPILDRKPLLLLPVRSPTSSETILVWAILPVEQNDKQLPQELEYELAVASLRASGINTEMIISDPEMAATLARVQIDYKAHLIYCHLASRSSFRAATAIVPTLANTASRSLLVAGGLFASNNAQTLIEEMVSLDAVIVGEIEATLVAIALALAEGHAWWQEAGLWCRHNGTLHQTPYRDPIDHLDSLPWAATDFVQAGSNVRRQILVGRGCNSACSYCNLQVQARQAFPLRTSFWRSRSPRAVVEEMEELWRQKGIERFALNSFVFFGYDDEGTRVVEGITREILARNLRIRFSLITHPGHFRRNLPLLPLLKQAGLESIYLGIDSILARVRTLCAVSFNEEDIYAALTALHEEPVAFRTGYIFYDPYLTLEEIGETLSFLREIRPLYSHLDIPYALLLQRQIINTVLHLRVGMPILEYLRRDGLIVREGSLENEPTARFRERATGRFLSLHRRFNREMLGPIAPLVFHPEADKGNTDLGFFLLDILATLRLRLMCELEASDEDVLSTLRSQAVDLLTPTWEVFRKTDLLPCAERELVDNFLKGKRG